MKEFEQIFNGEVLVGLTKKEVLKKLKDMQKQIEEKIERKIKFNLVLQTEYDEILIGSSLIDFKNNCINLKTKNSVIYETDEGELFYKKDGFDETRICDIEEIEEITYLINTGEYRIIDGKADWHL
ncbi:hypothetical protein [Clostridium uliginosum]|uniref:Uncharacterized protein n=1 Tax=Clostridium uliginosum TaxID=119641 RepID=A0A1I1GXN4_9CLOT|nr:hypothetical protein [Clostridium uliginosum]SFC14618.1 hypothetical protein SAMN05421842_10149 [Clostridium uliginosum]